MTRRAEPARGRRTWFPCCPGPRRQRRTPPRVGEGPSTPPLSVVDFKDFDTLADGVGRRAVGGSDQHLQEICAGARGIARMMTTERDRPSKTVARMAAIIESAVPDLVSARDLMDRFHRIIQHRKSADLESWIADAKPTLLASFTTGIINDRSAVKAALTEPWSNGQTEGQNTKLKLVKRQMYGRAKLDLLRARLLGAP